MWCGSLVSGAGYRHPAVLANAIVTIDHEGRVVEWNPAAERTFGHGRGDVLGREMAGLIVPPALRDRPASTR